MRIKWKVQIVTQERETEEDNANPVVGEVKNHVFYQEPGEDIADFLVRLNKAVIKVATSEKCRHPALQGGPHEPKRHL